MSVWMDHVKEVRKKCPGMSFKHVLQEAKKTYNKKTQTTKAVTSCSNHTKNKKEGSVKRKKSSKRKKSLRTRKGKGRGKSRKGRGKTMKHKVPKGFRCKAYPNGRGC
jgi:hypothetical protein